MANRFRFPANASLKYYDVLDTATGGLIPGIKVLGNHMTNDGVMDNEFMALSLAWRVRAKSIDELSKKLEFILEGR